MALALPEVGFLAMDARHCAGAEMQQMMAYAASVGSRAAQAEGAKGFIGNANDFTAHWFGNAAGRGTMPHALIGYAGSTVRAAEMFRETFPDEMLTVLVDYYGREITDGLAVCRRFPDLAAAGELALRLDTHGGRFLEGLDPAESYAVLERHAPGAIRRYRSETELRYLVGTGVSAAAVWRTWFDCTAPCVTRVSASCSNAAPSRNSSLRVLLPPPARPVQSSRLIHRSSPSSSDSRGSGSSGVGRWARRMRAKRARCMGRFPVRRLDSPRP
jgi:hypothetical protein